MNKIALIVEYQSHPGREAEFDALIREHARMCLIEEAGKCLRFEVLRPIDDNGAPVPNLFIANELFASPESLLAHRATPRFLRLADAFKSLLVNRRPTACQTDA